MGVIQVFKNGRFEELFAQLFIAGFGVINSWPIYEAMVLRSDKGKMPLMTTVKAIGGVLGWRYCRVRNGNDNEYCCLV
ncbi:hypothetical protein OSB04_022646 [Centaurea solstitialis]|uniref:Uncharacterized protein n=1 Tax=Centaurea solstitialis TaxID=347529 RepID=A0AA38TGD7_9ASTR|nr:hypothetical protein OSB04_022646 [Centaurea solstitialis]